MKRKEPLPFFISLYFLLILIILPGFFITGCVYYILDQGLGQTEILWSRQPLEEFQKENPRHPLLVQIHLVKKLKIIAKNRLGMNSPSYNYFVDLQREAIGYNVSACEPLSFHSMTWSFPLVGTVPYLGYFEKGYAVGLKYKLMEQGYDVVLQEIGGYSTLGWFEDPLFSTMLDREPYSLAELILHEITHGHIYHSSDSKFNENVATFIGQEGAKAFLRENYGIHSYLYQEYIKVLEDGKKFQNMIHQVYEKLKNLYHSSLSKKEKLRKKKKILKEAKVLLLKARKDFQSQAYQNLLITQWNNAMILSLLRYHEKQEVLRKIFQKMNYDFKRFILFLKKQSQKKNPWKGIE
ncbi:MAG: hypothetical protein D6785_11520 [Planctomycetota bacterium]|nr:MAG: hypothetical protein D6785_11520 [Planctomycetota bacterium]